MFKKILYVISLVVLVSAFLVIAPLAQDSVVWRFPSLEPGPGFWASDTIVDFANAVEERTDGRLKINYYWGGELGISPSDFPNAIRQGAIQAGHGSTAYYAKEIEGCAISAMPMVAVSSYNEAVEMHNYIREFINDQLEEKYRAKVLWMIPYDFVQPLTNKKIDDYTNLKGMKLRISGLLTGELIKECNGVPVPMPLAEVYSSLSKKVIDGTLSDIWNLKAGSLYEVVKYVHNFYYHSAASIYLVSLDALNALPEDIKQIVMEEAARVESEGIKEAYNAMEEGLKFAKSKKLEILDPTEEQVEQVKLIAKTIWDDWYQSASSEAQTVFIEALKNTGVTYTP